MTIDGLGYAAHSPTDDRSPHRFKAGDRVDMGRLQA